MTLSYEGVLAKPGYNKKYKDDVSWDELRKSALLYKRIPMIVAGGDHAGAIDPKNAVGFVDQKIDEEEQVIRGKYVFFKEKFDQIPADIQKTLATGQHVKASLGYVPSQDIRKYDHIAIGVDSPVFEDIGIHAESDFRYEETDGINMPEDEQQEEREEVTEPEQPTADIAALKAEIAELKQMIVDSNEKQEPEPEPETEEKVTEPEETEVQEETEELPDQQQPEVEPERTIPKDKPTPKDGWVETPEGRRVLTTQVAGLPKEEE